MVELAEVWLYGASFAAVAFALTRWRAWLAVVVIPVAALVVVASNAERGDAVAEGRAAPAIAWYGRAADLLVLSAPLVGVALRHRARHRVQARRVA